MRRPLRIKAARSALSRSLSLSLASENVFDEKNAKANDEVDEGQRRGGRGREGRGKRGEGRASTVAEQVQVPRPRDTSRARFSLEYFAHRDFSIRVREYVKSVVKWYRLVTCIDYD